MRGIDVSEYLPETMDSARVVQLIETTILRRGEGLESDPVRIVTQYWTFDGQMVAEDDPCSPQPYSANAAEQDI